jgi:regulator of sigma E protease
VNTLITIAIFLTVLVLLVVIHELGHFFAAKKSGVRVDEFGFGFPPKLFGKRFGQTEYTINLLPLGGFVKIKGIAGEEEGSEDADSFQALPFWRKLWILVAGIVMNFVLSIVLFAAAFAIGVQTDPSTVQPGGVIGERTIVVAQVNADSPAQAGGLQSRDQITAVGQEQVTSVDQFKSLMEGRNKTETEVSLYRDGEVVTAFVTPETFSVGEETITGIGIDIAEVAEVKYPPHLALSYGAQQSVELTGRIFSFLGGMIAGIFTSDTVDTESVAGPVGLAVVIRSAADSGIGQLIQVAGFLSVNLAVFNLLPIPMLDGGRIFLLIAERIRRKPLSSTTEALIHNTGFFLLIGMVIIVTLRDIIRL